MSAEASSATVARLVGILAFAIVAVTAPSAMAAPGTPAPPTVLFTEDFENGAGATPVLLSAYAGASGQTYTADPAYLTDCNGAVLESAAPDAALPASGCPDEPHYSGVRQLAHVLGVLGGGDPALNHAVTAFTSADAGAGLVQFETTTPIPLLANNRFITFSMDAAATSCWAAHPLYRFFLLDGANAIPASTAAINPCTDPGQQLITAPPIGTSPSFDMSVGSYAANRAVLFNGSAAGIRMVNSQWTGGGNDAAFDNIRILDATPQLDKSFAPATIPAGRPSRATFTITNTSELGAKRAWSFSDNLPAAVTVAPNPDVGTTCANTSVTAAAGSPTISVTGDLNAAQSFCTVSVNVTSTVPGTYVNDNVTCTGCNPPPPATLTVGPPLDLAIAKSAPATVAPGGQVTWAITVTNRGPGTGAGSTVEDEVPAAIASPATSTPGCTLNGARVRCVLSELAVGASTQIQVTGTAPTTNSTCFTNTATVVEDGDLNSSNNTATATTCTTPGPLPLYDMQMTKRTDYRRAWVGDTLTYTLTARNNGPDAAPAGYVVHDLVPERFRVLAVTAGEGVECARDGRDIRCPLPALAAGEQRVVRVRVRATEPGATRNVASVERTSTGPQCEPCDPTANNSDDAEVDVQEPVLGLLKRVNKKTLAAGEPTTYSIRVYNASNAAFGQVRVCDRLPSGLVFVRATPTARVSHGRHCWTVERLGPGKRKTFELTVRALAGTSGKKVNRATATSPDARTKTASRTVRVRAGGVRAGGLTG